MMGLMNNARSPNGCHRLLLATIARFRDSFGRGGFLGNVALLSGSTALANILVALSGPIITRLYTPADLGVLSVFTSLVAIATSASALRYELAFPLPKQDEEAANLLGLAVVIQIGFFVGLSVLLLLAGRAITQWLNAPALYPYLWLVPLGFGGAGSYETLSYWLVRTNQISLLGRTKLTQSGAQVAAQVGLGLIHGPVGLLIGDLIGRSLGSWTLWIHCYRTSSAAFRQVRWSDMLAAGYRYRRFPLMTAPASLVDMVCARLPSLVLAAAFGMTVAGSFELVTRLLLLPVMLIGRAVGTAFLAAASKVEAHEKHHLRRLYQKLNLSLGAMAVAISLACILPSPWLFPWVFGAEWREAGIFAAIMIPRFIAEFVAGPVNYALGAIERQDLQLTQTIVYSFAMALATFAVLLIPAVDARHAVMCYAAAGTIGYGTRVVMGYLAFRQLEKLLTQPTQPPKSE